MDKINKINCFQNNSVNEKENKTNYIKQNDMPNDSISISSKANTPKTFAGSIVSFIINKFISNPPENMEVIIENDLSNNNESVVSPENNLQVQKLDTVENISDNTSDDFLDTKEVINQLILSGYSLNDIYKMTPKIKSQESLDIAINPQNLFSQIKDNKSFNQFDKNNIVLNAIELSSEQLNKFINFARENIDLETAFELSKSSDEKVNEFRHNKNIGLSDTEAIDIQKLDEREKETALHIIKNYRDKIPFVRFDDINDSEGKFDVINTSLKYDKDSVDRAMKLLDAGFNKYRVFNANCMNNEQTDNCIKYKEKYGEADSILLSQLDDVFRNKVLIYAAQGHTIKDSIKIAALNEKELSSFNEYKEKEYSDDLSLYLAKADEKTANIGIALLNAGFNPNGIILYSNEFNDDNQVLKAVLLKKYKMNDEQALKAVTTLSDEQLDECVNYKKEGYSDNNSINLAAIPKSQLEKYKQYKNEPVMLIKLAKADDKTANKAIALFNAGFQIYDIDTKFLSEISDKTLDSIIRLKNAGFHADSTKNVKEELTDEQINNAIKLKNANCYEYGALNYTTALNNEGIDKAINLINKGIDQRYILRFAAIDDSLYKKVNDAINTGISNVVDLKNISELSEEEYINALNNVKSGLDADKSIDKAKYSQEGYVIKQSLNNVLNFDKTGNYTTFEMLEAISDALKSSNIKADELIKILHDFKYKKEDYNMYKNTYSHYVSDSVIDIQNDLIDSITDKMRINCKTDDETISEYFEKIVHSYLEDRVNEVKKRNECINNNIEYSNNENNTEEIELTDKEIEELREYVNQWDKKSYNYSLEELADKCIKKYIEGGGSINNQKLESYYIQKGLNRYVTSDNKPMARWMQFDDKHLIEYLNTIPDIGEIYTTDRMQSFSKNNDGAETHFHDNSTNKNVKLVVIPKNRITNAYDTLNGKYGNNEVLYPAGSKFKVLYKGYEERIHRHLPHIFRMEDNNTTGSHKQMTIYLQEC